MSEPLLGVKSPVEVQVGDETLRMSPLSDSDGAALDEYVASVLIRRAVAAAEGCNSETWDRIVGLAMREAVGISYSDPVGWRVMYNVAGLSRMFWQGIKRNHPNITLDFVITSLRNRPEQLRALMEQFKRANHLRPSPGGGGNSVP